MFGQTISELILVKIRMEIYIYLHIKIQKQGNLQFQPINAKNGE